MIIIQTWKRGSGSLFFMVVLIFTSLGTTHSQSIRLAWRPNSEHDVVRYNVYRSRAPQQWYHIATVQDTLFIDANITTGETYYYCVTAVDSAHNESSFSQPVSIHVGSYIDVGTWDSRTPNELSLEQNYPNPFNGETVIPYRIDRPGQVTITIYDILGRTVRELVNHYHPPGDYIVRWAGRDAQHQPVSSGVYVVRMTFHALVSTLTIHMLK